MVECICINDKNRPKEIPESKWVNEGEKYTIIYTVTVLPQRVIGVHISEIDLTEKEHPYEYFLLSRFGMTLEELMKLSKLIKDCSDSEFSMEELLKQTQLEEA
jgi:hypothetical protein